jgi:phage baseplate assembly protein W
MSVNQVNRQPDYSDLDLDFIMNPSTNDVTRKTGDAAIQRSIRNLIFTNFYERPFQSYIGSDVRSLLFEPTTSTTQLHLERVIKLCVDNFEPRVKLTNITVTYNDDEYGFDVRLEYTILNRNLPVVSTMFLERIR